MGFILLLFGQGRGPRPSSKKNTPQPKQQKKKKDPAPSELVFAVWARSVFVFCCLGGRRVLFFFFGCLGGCVLCFFPVWAGGVFFLLLFGRVACSFLLLFGRGACSFFAVWAGDGSSLTYRSAWLVFKGPTNKKDKKKGSLQETWGVTGVLASIGSRV